MLLVAGAGYGKTAALEEAIELGGARAVWVACGECAGRGRAPPARRRRRPASDGAGPRGCRGRPARAGAEPVDAAAAAGGLIAELERLLVERVVIVLDDAEELERTGAALALVEQLMNARRAPLSVAVASRQPLPLKLAKLRAAGLLAEIGPAELSFTAARVRRAAARSATAARSARRRSRRCSTRATGWPMGVALTSLAGSGERRRPRCRATSCSGSLPRR